MILDEIIEKWAREIELWPCVSSHPVNLVLDDLRAFQVEQKRIEKVRPTVFREDFSSSSDPRHEPGPDSLEVFHRQNR